MVGENDPMYRIYCELHDLKSAAVRIAEVLEKIADLQSCERANADFKRSEALWSTYRQYLGDLAYYREKRDVARTKELLAKLREFKRQYPEIASPKL